MIHDLQLFTLQKNELDLEIKNRKAELHSIEQKIFRGKLRLTVPEKEINRVLTQLSEIPHQLEATLTSKPPEDQELHHD